MELLEVKNVSKTYGKGEAAVRALKKVSFSVPKGEFVAVVGESGSGKTTALAAVRTLGGLTLDCDEIYHRLLVSSPGLLAAIDARFPGMVRNGQLDRKRLGSLVFGDKADLARLKALELCELDAFYVEGKDDEDQPHA